MVERFLLRGLLGLLLLCSSLTSATPAVAAPPAPPGPVPSPPATTPPSLDQLPTVLVYPFEVQTGANPKIGTAIAEILAQEMVAAGQISVLPVPQGVARADFLSNARSGKADFYISGYVTPIGDSAAVVEQVVSVDSGVILFSQTAQVSSVADVASQSLLARAQILNFVGRGTQNVATQPASTPAPTSTNGAQVNVKGIGNIVDSVFKHRSGGPRPSPTPAVKPSRGVIVAPLTASGAVAPAELTNALHELFFAMNQRYATQLTAVTTSVAQASDTICGSDRNNTIATGTLQETTDKHGHVQATFNLQVYTCYGVTLENEVGKGNSAKAAIDAAVAAYATAHPDNS